MDNLVTLTDKRHPNFLPFSSDVRINESTVEKVFDLSKNISLNHDAKHKFEEAFKLMEMANQIFVLGFGFEDSSFDKLKFHELKNGMPIISSCIGLSNIIRNRINKKLFNAINKIEFYEANSLVDLMRDKLE